MKKYWFIPMGLVFVAALAMLVKAAGGDTAPTPATVAPQVLDTAAPDITAMPARPYRETSPSGQWLIEVTAVPLEKGSRTYHVSVILRSADGKKEWKILDEWRERKDDPVDWVSLRSFIIPYLWLQDERSFYFFIRQPERCRCDPVKYDLERMDYGYGLYKVDTKSGTMTELASCILSLPPYSPDESVIAYLEDGQVVLLETDSGQKHTWSFPPQLEQEQGLYTTGISWSPDGKAFAFRFTRDGDTIHRKSTNLVIDTVSLSRTDCRGRRKLLGG